MTMVSRLYSGVKLIVSLSFINSNHPEVLPSSAPLHRAAVLSYVASMRLVVGNLLYTSLSRVDYNEATFKAVLFGNRNVRTTQDVVHTQLREGVFEVHHFTGCVTSLPLLWS